jgi:hypothetical protein
MTAFKDKFLLTECGSLLTHGVLCHAVAIMQGAILQLADYLDINQQKWAVLS